MVLPEKIKRKKYFYSLYIVTTTTTLIVVSLILLTIYTQISKNVYDREKKANILLLEQIKSSLINACETLESVCFTIYNSPEAQYAIYTKNQVNYDTISNINKLRETFVHGTPYVHSIYFYNPNSKKYLSTFKNLSYVDKDFQERTNGVANVRFDHNPTIRRVENQLVATYMMDDQYYQQQILKDTSAVYVNFEFSWILDNIQNLNDGNSNEKLFIIDSTKNIINASRKLIGQDNIDQEIIEKLAKYDKQRDGDTLTMDINGQSYFVTVQDITHIDWVIVKAEPYEDTFAVVGKIKNLLMVICLLAYGTIIGGFLVMTKGLYRPIGHIVKSLPSADEGHGMNEFSAIKNYYIKSRFEINRLTMLQKQGYLKDLLTGMENCDTTDSRDNEELDSIKVTLPKAYRVIYIKVANELDFAEQFNLKEDEELILFSLRNIITEIVDEMGYHEYVQMNTEEIVLILDDENQQEAIIEHMKKLKDVLSHYLHITVNVAMSTLYRDSSQLTRAYIEAREFSQQRFMIGKNSIITSKEVDELGYQVSEVDYDKTVVESFIHSMLCGKIDDAKEQIHDVMIQLRLLQPAYQQKLVSQFLQEFNQGLKRIREYSEDVSVIEEHKEILEMDKMKDIWDLKTKILKVLDGLSQLEGRVNVKYMTLVRDIKAYIENNYGDPNMSVTAVADYFQLSTSYIGRLFKQYEKVTLNEFINDVRLHQSIIMMKNTNVPLSEIAYKVGYQNESYYFRIFKKKFQVTPRNYMREQ